MTTIPVLEFPQARGHEAEELRFCRDCKWCELWKRSPEESRCTAPQTYTETISPITGATVRKHEWAYCATHRAHDHSAYLCGASGRWFEPRESEQTEAAQ